MPAFCDLCRKVVPLNQPHYRQETGWTRPRVQGGTNALKLRSETGKVAHVVCVDLAKLGKSVDQATLL